MSGGMHPIRPCPMDLSTTSLIEGVRQYEERFGVTPDLLVVSLKQNFVAEELLHGATEGLQIFMAVRWIPEDAWMLTRGSMGIIYSEGL